MECLFVGGTNDGERIEVTPDGISPFTLPAKAPMAVIWDPQAEVAPAIGVEVYDISIFYATEERPGIYHANGKKSKEFILYKRRGMTSIDLMQALIDGYRTERK